MLKQVVLKARSAARWRLNKLKDQTSSVWALSKIALRWNFKSSGRRHRLPAPLIVSLTSYPARFPTLHLTLKSLLSQSVKADRIVLWIAEGDLAALPQKVTDLKKSGLEIRSTADTRSYKKILPALDHFPQAYICTADDDIYYWSTWLEELVTSVNGRDDVVSCHRGHKIKVQPSGEYLSYSQWEFDIGVVGEVENLFPTGVAGVLYSPRTLTHSPEDREDALGLCPNADDVWLYWIGRRNGARYMRPAHRRSLTLWKGSQETALWEANLTNGRNDTQIRQLAEKHGYPAIG